FKRVLVKICMTGYFRNLPELLGKSGNDYRIGTSFSPRSEADTGYEPVFTTSSGASGAKVQPVRNEQNERKGASGAAREGAIQKRAVIRTTGVPPL
ncbi:MAG: hypothetical protein QMD46_13915, partial [Methanomicrobiales archaeon]|nr:hypothetical protein [Methanomicrobiales archaeon]